MVVPCFAHSTIPSANGLAFRYYDSAYFRFKHKFLTECLYKVTQLMGFRTFCCAEIQDLSFCIQDSLLMYF